MIRPATHSPGVAVHPDFGRLGYSFAPCPAGYRVVHRRAEVAVRPDLPAALSAAAWHHRGEPDPGPIDPSLCGVPAGFVPPPFVPEEEAWMYPSDDDKEAHR